MPPAVGGCICGGVRPAATSVAATIPCPGTQHCIGERLDTRSSDRSNRARTGSGTTGAMTTTKVPNLPHRNAILRIRRSLVRAIECRATGPSCSVSKTDSSPRRIDLVGGVGDNRRRLAVDVEGVDEAVQSHHPRAGEPELDDLCGTEMLAQPLVELVVHRVMISGEQVDELDGHLLLRRQRAVARGEQARDILVVDRVMLARLATGFAFAELGAANAQELQDPAAEQGAGTELGPGHVDLFELGAAIREDL